MKFLLSYKMAITSINRKASMKKKFVLSAHEEAQSARVSVRHFGTSAWCQNGYDRDAI
jgi:hypothetical protein